MSHTTTNTNEINYYNYCVAYIKQRRTQHMVYRIGRVSTAKRCCIQEQQGHLNIPLAMDKQKMQEKKLQRRTLGGITAAEGLLLATRDMSIVTSNTQQDMQHIPFTVKDTADACNLSAIEAHIAIQLLQANRKRLREGGTHSGGFGIALLTTVDTARVACTTTSGKGRSSNERSHGGSKDESDFGEHLGNKEGGFGRERGRLEELNREKNLEG